MGKGRAPCCDKTKVKRGPWSPDEDMKLISFIHNYGHENWRSLPKQAGLLRCGKSCRLRWINYLRPDVKRGNFSAEEEETIIKLHQSFGNKWSKIASKLPGRTDNEIKNVWHTHLKKRLTSDTNLNEDAVASKENSQESSPNASLSFGSSSMSSKEDDIKIGSEVMGMLQEVEKPEMLEMSFDLDSDIWSFLDDSSYSLEQYENLTPQEEDEVEKWFKYLESELGLEENNNQQQQQGKGDELLIH